MPSIRMLQLALLAATSVAWIASAAWTQEKEKNPQEAWEEAIQKGIDARNAGKLAASIRHCEAAIAAAEAVPEALRDICRARSYFHLGITYFRQENFAGAEEKLKPATSHFTAAGSAGAEELPVVWFNLASAQAKQKKYADAAASMEQCVAAREKLQPKGGADLIAETRIYSAYLEQAGNLKGARAARERVARLAAEVNGAASPRGLADLFQLGSFYERTGARDEAIRVYSELIKIRRDERDGGKSSEQEMMNLLKIGELHAAAGQSEQSLAAYRAADKILEQITDPSNPYRLKILPPLLAAAMKLGNSQLAGETQTKIADLKAIQDWRAKLPGLPEKPSPEMRAAALEKLAEMRSEAERYQKWKGPLVDWHFRKLLLMQRDEWTKEREAASDEWLAAVESAYGPDHLVTAQAYHTKANALASFQQQDAALAALRKSWEIYQRGAAVDHDLARKIVDGLAAASMKGKDHVATIALLRRLRDEIEIVRGERDLEWAKVSAVLGNHLVEIKELAKAEEAFAESLAAWPTAGTDQDRQARASFVARLTRVRELLGKSEPQVAALPQPEAPKVSGGKMDRVVPPPTFEPTESVPMASEPPTIVGLLLEYWPALVVALYVANLAWWRGYWPGTWLFASLLSWHTLILAPAILAALPDRSRADRRSRLAAELDQLLVAVPSGEPGVAAASAAPAIRDRSIGDEQTRHE